MVVACLQLDGALRLCVKELDKVGAARANTIWQFTRRLALLNPASNIRNNSA